ncbi:unnamed protein product, partial [Brenthis ino]
MDENAEIILKTICCTCLSVNRKLNQLCRIDNGVNNLFFLLSHDSEAYDVMFYQNPTHLFVCWECKSKMHRLCAFREQTCKAQKQLSDLIDGKIDSVYKIKTLSQLTYKYQNIYDQELTANDETLTDFIDCGPNLDDVKSESDSDTPSCDLQNEKIDEQTNSVVDEIKKSGQLVDDENIEADKLNNLDSPYLKLKEKKITFKNSTDTKYLAVQLSKEEINEMLEREREDKSERTLQRKQEKDYNGLIFKCKFCALAFKDHNEMEIHCLQHTEVEDQRKTKEIKSSRKKKDITTDKTYLCTECNKCFVNRTQRLRHMMKFHHAGYPCAVCGKTFTSKNHMVRHETIHFGPFRREKCPICGRMIRCDLTKAHARIHQERKKIKCIQCNKYFVSERSYQNHLKYTSNHALHYREYVLKYKCSTCQKGYRTKTELRDHINYNHMGKTQHKCPICDKAIATRRGVGRHVKRVHQDIKENARDVICQTCGKAFRHTKSLEEHERIHTGERPLSCTICGRTFRQRASLYTHNRRVHKMPLKQRVIEYTDSDSGQKSIKYIKLLLCDRMSNGRVLSNGYPVNQQGVEMNISEEMVKPESSITEILSYFNSILLEGWCYYVTKAELIFKHINMLTRKEDICFSLDNNFSVKVSFSQRPEMSVNDTLTSVYDIKNYMETLQATILCEGTGIYYRSYAPKCTGQVSSKRSRQIPRCMWCRTLRKRLLVRKFTDATKITIQNAREAVEKYKKQYKRLVLKKRILDQELITAKENAQRSEELMRNVISELPDTKKLSILEYLNGSKLENHGISHNYLVEHFREQDLSKLANLHQNEYGHIYKEEVVDNFIDCGSEIVIKNEINMDVSSDVIENNMSPIEKSLNKPILEIQPLTLKSVAISVLKNRKLDSDTDKKYYSIIQLSDEEMYERIEKLKNEENFLKASYKCESCVLVFKDEKELGTHNTDLHLQKPRHMQCTICNKFILYWRLNTHEAAHRQVYGCATCGAVSCASGMLEHLRGHAVPFNDLINLRKTVMLLNPSLKSKKKKMDGKKEYGYKCSECNKCFEKQYLRYKHVLKCHREGFKCETCGKTFTYKNTLNKHILVHELLLPREECPICNKLVRSDRLNAHAKIHSDRQQFYCNTCDKTFVSLDSFEKHLKNSKTHALHDVLKYKCTLCSKGFRTLTALKDHINYYHMGKTDYKCPICNKALSTRRGVTRHVRRTHQGLKEKIGDKILCQICGKTFRDKKCLVEHELIHTGEKPLSCDICSRTFRQSACLYTHRRRVHNMPARRIVHTGDDVHPSDGQNGQSH